MHDRQSALHARGILTAALVAACAMTLACQSAPVLAWEGARHYARGNDALDRDEPRVAIREFERAAELVPHASEVRNHLGLAFLSAGERENARAAFEEALELDCENEAARINLSRLNTIETIGVQDLDELGRNSAHVE